MNLLHGLSDAALALLIGLASLACALVLRMTQAQNEQEHESSAPGEAALAEPGARGIE